MTARACLRTCQSTCARTRLTLSAPRWPPTPRAAISWTASRCAPRTVPPAPAARRALRPRDANLGFAERAGSGPSLRRCGGGAAAAAQPRVSRARCYPRPGARAARREPSLGPELAAWLSRAAATRVQVRDAKTGGRLSPQTLESLCDSLWQVAIGAAHPKRLSGGSAAAAAASAMPGAARRANSGGSYAALSLTTVAEASRMRTRLSFTRGLTQASPLCRRTLRRRPRRSAALSTAPLKRRMRWCAAVLANAVRTAACGCAPRFYAHQQT